MGRLPIPGFDDGQWGDLLNEYLRVSLNEDGTLRSNVGPDSVDSIADLKALDPASVSDTSFVFVRGFDTARDGGGGLFYRSAEVLVDLPLYVLDGIAFNSNHSGSWHRHFVGPIHTSYVGIKPTSTPGTFDSEGIAAQNTTRWNNLAEFLKFEVWELLDPHKVDVRRNTIFLDPGIHEFEPTVNIPQGVGLDGVGPGKSVMRFEATSGTCVQVGEAGDWKADHNKESGFDIVKNVSIVHDTPASTGSEIGIAFDNTFRRCELNNVHVQGFNVNVDINAFGIDIRHCFITEGYRRNIGVGPEANSMMIIGCRIDATRHETTGESVLINSPNYGARSILIQRCDIQRTKRVALRVVGVASIAVRDCFFEGNNQTDGYHPDIWIEGARTRNVIIDGCYFTGTGRFNGTSSKAINIRSDVTGGARFQITNNEQANNTTADNGGSFTNFIDVDANVGLQIVEFNNLHSAPNSIPGNVVVKTVS